MNESDNGVVNQNIDFILTEKDDVEKRKTKCQNAIKYLHECKDKFLFSDLFNDPMCLNALECLKSVMIVFDMIDQECQTMFHEIFTKLIANECTSIYDHTVDENGDFTNKLKFLSNLKLCFEILNNTSFESAHYRRSLKNQDTYIECMCQLMANISNLDSLSKDDDPVCKSFESILELSLSLIENISRRVYKYEKEWKQFHLIEILIVVSNRFEAAKFRRLCVNAIRNVYDFDESEDDTVIDEINDFHVNKQDQNEDKIRKRNNALGYVIKSHENIEQLMRDQKFLRAIKYISFNCDADWFSSIDGVAQSRFMQVLVKFLEHSLKILLMEVKSFNFEQVNVDNEANIVKVSNYMFYIFEFLILPYLKSFEFCMKYCEQMNSLEIMFEVFNNMVMVNAYDTFKNMKHVFNFAQNRLIDSCKKCLAGLKYFSNKSKLSWHFLNFNSNFCLMKTVAKYYNVYIDGFFSTVAFTVNYADDQDESQFNNFKQFFLAKRSKDPDERRKAIVLALHTLKEFGKTPEKALESRRVLDALEYIHSTDINLKSESQQVFLEGTYNLMKYGFQRMNDLLKLLKTNSQYEFEEPVISIIKLNQFLLFITSKTQNMSNNSMSFCIKFHEQSGESVKMLLDAMNNQTILNLFLKERSNKLLACLSEGFYRRTFGTLHNISKAAYKFKEQWTNVDAFNVLLKLSKKVEPIQKYYELVSIMTIANIASSEDLNNFSASLSILANMTTLVEAFALGFTKTKVPMRIKIQINEDDLEKVDVISFSGWNLIEICGALYQFAINDNIKGVVYETLNLKEHLRTIIYHGNQVEQEYAFKLLRQLCFDKKIAHNIRDDSTLMKFIQDILAKDPEQQRVGLRKECEGIMWLLTSENKKAEEMKNEDAKHIMISYNSESRDLCVSIKDKLVQLGYKVWIDVENIHGSSIDAMAKAVEQSWCVLICMTEKYKESANCRSEAEYTVQLKKPFVPLFMQKTYKPDGWLGFMLGTKVYIDFTKYDFEECIKRLLKELNALSKPTPPATPPPKAVEERPKSRAASSKKEREPLAKIKEEPVKERVTTPVLVPPPSAAPAKSSVSYKQKSVHYWNNEDCERWFDDRRISPTIKLSLSPCDGKVLEQLFKMSQDVPEFFFTTLRSDTRANLKEIAVFTNELKTLFF